MDLPVYSVKAHNGMINCIDGIGGLGVGYGAPEIATGGRDGAVKVCQNTYRFLAEFLMTRVKAC